MTTGSAVHDLKTLILSFHPVIAIETVEEDRAANLVKTVAAELNMPVFDWTITQGLIKLPGTQSMHGTTEPLGVVRHIGTILTSIGCAPSPRDSAAPKSSRR